SFDKLYFNKLISADIRGVGFVPIFFKGTLEKLGIQTVTFRAGEYKSAVEQFTRKDLSPKARENLEEIGGDIWQVMAEAFGAKWDLSLEKLNKMASELYFQTPGVLREFGAEFATNIIEVKSRLNAGGELSDESPL